MLSILGTDFIAHWAYEERISAHAQPAVKCELFYMYNLCWAYAERILSHTEHTRNEFHRMLSILGTDFIACWACAEMFKSRISLPIRIRFLKISCYRPLGPYGFGFCKKSQKKNFMLVYQRYTSMRYFWIFFWLKSNPYMPLVNFRKKFRFFSFDFRQNFDVRTFPRWLSIRGTKFFWDLSKKVVSQNLHYSPIRWVPKRFFQILIFYSRNLHFN